MSDIHVVYAKAHVVLPMPDGQSIRVTMGSHWPAEDPVVRQHPGAFTDDPRYGMSWTGRAPEYMTRPPSTPGPVEEASAAPGERRATRRNV